MISKNFVVSMKKFFVRVATEDELGVVRIRALVLSLPTPEDSAWWINFIVPPLPSDAEFIIMVVRFYLRRYYVWLCCCFVRECLSCKSDLLQFLSEMAST